jgi:hypothetical protein
MRDKAIFNTHSSVAKVVDDQFAYDKENNIVVLNEDLIEIELARLEAEHAATEYARLRKSEYPSIEECVHAILDDELDALQAVRAEIKARYPKP